MPNHQRVDDHKPAMFSVDVNKSVTRITQIYSWPKVRIGLRRRAVLPALSLFLISASLHAQSLKPSPADGIQYVAMKGMDSNDGLSWGTAKATITAAYTALPPCSESNVTYRHCGVINVGAGDYAVASQIEITSPYIRIRGQGSNVSNINFTGTSGCAFLWDAPNNTAGGATYSGGLFDLRINGNGASRICGLHTQGTPGFQMRGVTIYGFTGNAAIGWWDDEVYNGANFVASNERYKINAELANNTTSWLLTDNGSLAPNDTFGYGNFNLWINTYAGQIGVSAAGGNLSFSNIHILDNGNSRGSETGISLAKHAQWFSDIVNLHFEGINKGVVLDGTSRFFALGAVNEGPGVRDSINPSARYALVRSSNDGNYGIKVDYNGSTAFGIQVGGESTTTFWGTGVGYAPPGTSHSNVLASFGPGGISAGQLTLSKGYGSHSFRAPYATAPVCNATDTTRQATLKVTSSRTEITVTGTAGDVVSWICTPAAN